MSHSPSRRRLLGAATASAGLLMAGAAPRFSAPIAATAKPLAIRPARKALVFIMLDGGNDSFNMLVPRDTKHYREYQNSRANLALANSELLPLRGFSDSQGRQFGLHPSMPELQALFAQQKLSFIANIAPLVEPVSKASYRDGSARLPLGLMSHADQFKHWQTARADLRLNRGWFGSIADSLEASASSVIPTGISLAGNNILQAGQRADHYSITQQGSVGLEINQRDTALSRELFGSFNRMLNRNYPGDPFKQSYLEQTREAQSQHEVFRNATEQVAITSHFSDSDLSRQLRKVAQSIAAAQALGHQQQTFFLRYIGWDHHDELLDNHARMLRVLSQALGEFQTALDTLKLTDQVITFTGSDFGRTLTSNGNGTDHGWGGNTLVMGGPIAGGRVFGNYPSLALGEANPLDIGDGVLIPTLPSEALYVELARWFGVASNQLTQLFPNLNNFPSRYQQGLGLIS